MTYTVYPAIFHKEEDEYIVSFPDLKGCVTGGEDIEEAFNMAGDALFAWLDAFKNEEIPHPSDVESISATEGDIVTLIKAMPYEDRATDK